MMTAAQHLGMKPKVLLVQPLAPKTYWGFQYSVHLIGKGAPLPPLGLATLAALLPADWPVRLVDLNVEPLREEDLRWADALLLTGMLVHAASMQEVLARAKARGLRTVVGGPAASARPELFPLADHLFCGEAEERLGPLVEALEQGGGARVLSTGDGPRPALGAAGPPRYDLLDLRRYTSMSLQYSRGCPFSCEFCDIVELFGRVPRVKPAATVLGELEALHRAGWRGTVFFVDDNFIGNRRAVAALLPELTRWQEAHGWPFELYTEASVDLASEPALVAAMVGAGFTTVFLGLESPSPEALRESHKLQNLKLGPEEAVARLTRAGLEVFSGFIVGFDADRADIFEAQRALIAALPVPTAMVGLLMALPGTALWRRLEAEGRLRRGCGGDQFERPNFEPALDERLLLEGYRGLLAALYAPAAYYARCERLVAEIGPGRTRPLTPGSLLLALRILLAVGVASPRRGRFWRLLARTRGRPHAFARALAMALQGEHLIRYTAEDVLPRIDAALAALAAERAAPGYGRESTSGPSAVTATVCSQCAESLPSAVTTVQPSPSTRTSCVPRFTIGSIASTIPGCSRGLGCEGAQRAGP